MPKETDKQWRWVFSPLAEVASYVQRNNRELEEAGLEERWVILHDPEQEGTLQFDCATIKQVAKWNLQSHIYDPRGGK